MSIEAMKQAMEAFKKIHEGCGFVKKDNLSKESNELATLVRKDCNFAMNALRQAIEQAEKIVPSDYPNSHQPVAWINKQELAYMSAAAGIGETQWKTNLGLKPEPGDVPLYTAPLPPIYTTPIPPPECQTEEEKRAFAFGWWKAWEKKREWVSLTDEEIKEIVGPWGETPIKGYTRKLFDAIEAKLREKNT
jgi:hypothetical protein